MKIKTISSRRKKSSSIKVRLTKGEVLEYAQAEFLFSTDINSFLPFSYKEEKGNILFTYDTTDLLPIKVFLETSLSLVQFHTLINDVVRLVEQCESAEFAYMNCLFDLNYVFFDSQANCTRFAYVPAGNLATDRHTINDYLHELATKISFICEEDIVHAQDLVDYLQRQTVFSLLNFKTYIIDEEKRRGNDFSHDFFGSNNVTSTRPGIPKQEITGGFDIVKNLTGSASARELRQNQSMAEQIVFDVADTPSAPLDSAATPTPFHELTPAIPFGVSAPLPDLNKDSDIFDSSSKASAEFAAKTEGSKTTDPQEEQLNTLANSFSFIRLSTMERCAIFPGKDLLIGRSKRCDITIKGNTNISRVHAQIHAESQCCFLTDLNSTNKTYIAGAELPANTPIKIKRGDTFKIADELFCLE